MRTYAHHAKLNSDYPKKILSNDLSKEFESVFVPMVS